MADAADFPSITPKQVKKLLDRYRVTSGKGFKLKDYATDDTGGLSLDKPEATALLQFGIQRLSELQERLYAQDRWSVLCIFQARDAAGKDSTIKHVMSGVNPQGVQVTAFKAPGPEDLDHDFLWRINKALPERGRIGIFNRSHYEEVLVARVHPDILERQRLPAAVTGKDIWDNRLEDIAAFERYLARQGTVVLKFFLNVSRKEQKQRLLERLDEQEKHWKFDPRDLGERDLWDQYHAAYQAAIAATAAPHAPWFVVPADNKWFTRLVVAAAMIEALHKLDLRFPKIDDAQRKVLAEARLKLMAENGKT